jgi:hypothetical protein
MTDELNQLQAEFEAIDNEAHVEPAPEASAAAGEGDTGPEAGPLNTSENIQAVVTTVVTVLSPMFPSLQKVYTPEVVQAVGDATAPLANKYNLNILGWLTKYQEEIAFATVMIPVGMSTYGAVLHDLQAKDQAEEPEAEAEPVTLQLREEEEGNA